MGNSAAANLNRNDEVLTHHTKTYNFDDLSSKKRKVMKRKLIQTLLATNQLQEEVSKLLPEGSPNKNAALAREILTVAMKRFMDTGITDPQIIYEVMCESTGTQLAGLLKDATPTKIGKREIARAQALLTPLLTSKAGRPKTNDLSRKKQNAVSQARRRERLKKEGRAQLNVYVSSEAAVYLDAIKQIHNCENQAEALELVLESAMKGEVLQKRV
jgi:hypothetical protein